MTPGRRRVPKILVPVDFGESALEAWRYVRTLARRSNARIHVLHVVKQPQVGGLWRTERARVQMSERLAEADSSARRGLARLVRRSGRRARRVMIATAIGPIVDRILEYAARNRIDVIVMGTHRRGFVGRRLFGSVADRVVQRSPVPVVRVHRGAQPVRIRRRPRMHASRAR